MNKSTLSKLHKSTEQKRKAVERNRANRALRASLHAQKSAMGNAMRRNEIQIQINNIGAAASV